MKAAVQILLLVGASLLAAAQSPANPAAPAAPPQAVPQTLKDNFYPRLVKLVLPQAPPDAPAGRAEIVIHVGADGLVTDVEVLFAPEGAANLIVDAAKQWTFEPLVKNGKAVPSTVPVRDLRLNPPVSKYETPEDSLRGAVRAFSEGALAPADRLALQEEQYAATPERARATLLPNLAKFAYAAGSFEKSRSYAQRCLEATAGDPENPRFGNNLFTGNLILGRLALRDGKVDEAKERLLAAARTTGSPTLRTGGPNTSLAKELLDKGERDAVLQFFELCRGFWKNEHGKLDAWSADVRAGKTPDFGANMVY
jgi:hypothetical protein